MAARIRLWPGAPPAVGQTELLEEVDPRVPSDRCFPQVIEPADELEVLATGELFDDGGRLAGEGPIDRRTARRAPSPQSRPSTITVPGVRPAAGW